MSGQQVGTIVGGVIGAYFGNPQLGMAIGGLIGGAIDPEKMYGPRIGDGPQQSSSEGVPIPWILGVAAVQGNLVQKSARREVKKKKRQGKGGPVIITYEAHQDFAIMVCESSETRGSTMVGVQMVKCNGKIVYDMRPDANFQAESAKWKQGVDFLFGGEDQMPHPTLEAITGVGNTPAYRGVFVAVFKDFNLTEFGDSIPTFEWVMVSEGEEVTITTTSWAAPVYGEFIDATWPLADPETAYTYVGRRETPTGSLIFYGDSVNEVLEQFGDGYSTAPNQYLGYAVSVQVIPTNAVEGLRISTADTPISAVNALNVVLVYNEYLPSEVINIGADTAACPLIPTQSSSTNWVQDWAGNLLAKFPDTESHPDLIGFQSCSGSTVILGIAPVYIEVIRKVSPNPVLTGDPCLLGVPVLLPDDPSYMVDCAGTITPVISYEEVAGDFHILQKELIQTIVVNGVSIDEYLDFAIGPVIPLFSENDTEAFWEAAYDAAVLAGTMPPGLVYEIDYPDQVPTAYEGSSSTTHVTNEALSVATAIERICNRGGLVDAQLDTSEVDQTLLGYPIAGQYDAAECVRPLLAGFSLYGSEYDAQLHFRKFGADVDVVIDPQDFIEGADESDESIRDQAKEYPRKLSLSYIDIAQNFAVRPQTRQSITPDVRSIGEQSLQVPLVMTDEQAAQLVDVFWKRSRARVQGRRKFSLPYGTATDCYLALTTGEPSGINGKRYMIDQIGLEDGQINLELLFDRQSAYTSNVTAIPSLPPTPPPSTISGPTLFAVMNLPVMRDQDDRLGVYVAAGGLLPSWRGALLQISRDEEATWETAIEAMTSESTIGYLLTELPLAPSTATDFTNTFGVAVHGGELDSITETQRLNEGNPAALMKADGTAELIQFQTATEGDPDDYTLSILERGRLNTVPAEHSAGTRFVFLDAFYFVPLEVADIGRTLYFRPVSFGSSPENNASYAITFDPAVSQTEWRPEYLVGVRAGNDLSVYVTPRLRLGTDTTPVASANFTGFRWTFTVGADSYTVDTEKPAFSLTEDLQIAAFGSAQPSIDVSVSQLNRYTGLGPTLEETL